MKCFWRWNLLSGYEKLIMQFKEKVPGGQETGQKVGGNVVNMNIWKSVWNVFLQIIIYLLTGDAGHSGEDECARVHWGEPNIQVVSMEFNQICLAVREK